MSDPSLDGEAKAMAKLLREIAGVLVSAASWLEATQEHGIESIDNPKFLNSVSFAVGKALWTGRGMPVFWGRLQTMQEKIDGRLSIVSAPKK
jgi:hypothetical protein